MICKTLAAILILFCIAFFVPQSVSGQDVSPNTLSAAEKAAGWKLLFDGKSLSGWRKFRRQDPPGPCWVIENSALKRENGHKRGECGDIVTKDEYSSFEFAFEWRIAPNGNSGVKYLIVEDRPGSWEKVSMEKEIENLKKQKQPNEQRIASVKSENFMYSPIGFEFQLLDDALNADARVGGSHKTGALYDLIAPSQSPARPAGEWNQSRILVRGKHIEHWINGSKVVEFERGSEQLNNAVAQSKFKDFEGFGTATKGRIDLQDHNSEVWFRSMKIRVLP
jgi:hypothetical protein